MSIRVSYKGNIGNCLFQYVYARLLAERNQFYLHTPFPYQKLLQTTPHINGKNYNHPKVVFEEPLIRENNNISDENDLQNRYAFYEHLNKKLPPAQYVLNGYFEYSELFDPYESLIKSYFKTGDFKKNTDDIVMNVRLGDFANINRIIDPDWYINILEQEKFNKLYVVGAKADEPYLKVFKRYDPIIVPSSPVNDFHFIRSFDKIICSNSTFCWWAAFLSQANTIYIADKWLSPLITSCKNSINIKADYLKSYTTSFYYSPVQPLINFSDKVKLELDNYITPTRNEVKQVVIDCLKVIYNHIRRLPNVTPFTIQLDVKDVCRFSINVYQGGSWLSEGSYPLADCQVYFADWKSFYNWIFWGLRDVTDPYIKVKGNIDDMVSQFDLTVHQDHFTQIFNDFTNKAALLIYTEIDNKTEKILSFLEKGIPIVFFDKSQSNLGKLYALYKADSWCKASKGQYGSNNKFYLFGPASKKPLEEGSGINEIYHKAGLKNIQIQQLNITLALLPNPLISTENALRIFEIMPFDSMVLDSYFIEKSHSV